MDKMTSPHTSNNYDYDSDRPLITPHGPDPPEIEDPVDVLYTIPFNEREVWRLGIEFSDLKMIFGYPPPVSGRLNRHSTRFRNTAEFELW